MPSLLGGLLTDTGAGGDAAALQALANREAVAELKRQFGITQENVAPFLQAGQGAVDETVNAASIAGLDQRLGDIFGTDTFKKLLDERTRSMQGQLSAGGLTRSGTALKEAADLPIDLGLGIEGTLASRLQNLFTGGQNAALGLGQIGQQNASSIAGLHQDTGKARSSGSLLDAQTTAARNENLITGVGEVVSLFFSDPRLKENVIPIGSIGPLKVYQWDWIEKAKGTIVGMCHNIGFMADEVKKHFPQFVHHALGFDLVDYDSVLNKLEAELCQP